MIEYYKNLSIKSIEGEIWKDVNDYEGLYAVSNLGRVRSYPRLVLNEGTQTYNKRRERILRQHDVNGYLGIALQKNKARKYTLVHIVVGTAFIENSDNKPYINHKCGNKKDNRPSELEWVTPKENNDHAISTGLLSRIGQANGNAKLTDSQINEIRKRYIHKTINGYRGNREILSKEYGVSKSLISQIAKYKTWKHL